MRGDFDEDEEDDDPDMMAPHQQHLHDAISELQAWAAKDRYRRLSCDIGIAAIRAVLAGDARPCHGCGYTLVRCYDCKRGGAVACFAVHEVHRAAHRAWATALGQPDRQRAEPTSTVRRPMGEAERDVCGDRGRNGAAVGDGMTLQGTAADCLVERLREGATVLDEPCHRDALAQTMEDAAAALSSLARDLAAARQERDAAREGR